MSFIGGIHLSQSSRPIAGDGVRARALIEGEVTASSMSDPPKPSNASLVPSTFAPIEGDVKVTIDGRQAATEEALIYAQPRPVDDQSVGSPTQTTNVRDTTDEQDRQSQETRSSATGELTEAEAQQVEQLRQRDLEVKRHEQAHAAVGGAATGAPSYDYTQSPDGKRYAVSGEVSVSFPTTQDPKRRIDELQQVKRAANAPAQPSAQDRAVAREADQRIQQAQLEVLEALRSEAQGKSGASANEAAQVDTDPGFSQGSSLAQGPSAVYERALRELNALEAQGRTPGSVFTATA